MCTTPRQLSLSLLFAFAAACHTGAEPDGSFAPAPMGETAAVHEESIDCTPTEPISYGWVDVSGRANQATFRFTYRTRVACEALAAECVRNRWQTANDCAQRVLAQGNLSSEAWIECCERDLQVQLTEAIFPCTGGEPLATVTTIHWHGRPGF
ncbi:MAG: hypothetical protein Q7T30_00610 [Planctomycetota bacterium]|nr:hypothetical protein [Planctomycetota bacterium]